MPYNTATRSSRSRFAFVILAVATDTRAVGEAAAIAIGGTIGLDAMVGGPKEMADKLEEMFAGRGCDGFVIAATYVPGSYADFVTHVVPELQRRGLFHTDYAGKTLRENLGLRRPAAGAWKLRPQAAAE